MLVEVSIAGAPDRDLRDLPEPVARAKTKTKNDTTARHAAGPSSAMQ
jgi:hypothetical protein